MNVSVIGTGYVGLVSGVCLAELGHTVACVDLDERKVASVNEGRSPIFEDRLELLLQRNVGRRFSATTDLNGAVRDSQLTLIAVGTPFAGGQINLTHVRAAARQVGVALGGQRGYHVVAVKSTVVPGTTDTVVRGLLEEASGLRAGADFGLAMNPEFLTEGQAVADFMRPDRLVLGALDGASMEVLDALYVRLPKVPTLRTNLRTAEMIKYASNSLLATAISFSNEMARLCAATGQVDVVEVMEGVHSSSYLTVVTPEGRVKAPLTSFLQAGCGFGGSCLPKDVKALVAHGERLGVKTPLLRAVLTVNAGQPTEVLHLLARHFPTLAGLKVGVLGLAFKPDTDDVRESPALEVIDLLLRCRVTVKAFDPVAVHQAQRVLGDQVEFAPTLDACLQRVDAVVLLTRWKQFESVPEKLAAMQSPPLLVDGRRQFPREAVPRYAGIGL